jgi:hypothetical protein
VELAQQKSLDLMSLDQSQERFANVILDSLELPAKFSALGSAVHFAAETANAIEQQALVNVMTAGQELPVILFVAVIPKMENAIQFLAMPKSEHLLQLASTASATEISLVSVPTAPVALKAHFANHLVFTAQQSVKNVAAINIGLLLLVQQPVLLQKIQLRM